MIEATVFCFATCCVDDWVVENGEVIDLWT